jgi:hypothetical protein
MEKKYLIWGAKILVCVFALIGLTTTIVFIGMQFGIFNVRGSSIERNSSFDTKKVPTLKVQPCIDIGKKICAWNETPEWDVVQNGLNKDKDIIERVAKETGVPSRLIIATVAPEQLRFFSANRESFKKYFEPLKILGSLSKFSLGVSGIKQDTAVAIENHIKNPQSAFYPGGDVAPLIAYEESAVHDSTLYSRLTDAHNHYYSYLYTALFLKEVQSQWQQAGFINNATPGVLVTIFNTGFGNSHPNANPSLGGANISIGGKNYLFGELGEKIYTSDELLVYFPK